jgi:hypothetical protein
MSSTTLQTIPATRNPFLSYAEAMTRRTIDGEILKFVKGEYVAGKDGVVVPVGTEFVAVMDTLAIGYLKWKGGKPVDSHMGLIIDGFTPPRRSEVDEIESDTWEVDKSGDLKDPWQFTNTIVLIELAAKGIYTFGASTRGGLDAIGKLCREHAKKSPAGAYPIIGLDVGSYQHTDRSIGKVKFPIFEVGKKVAAAEDFDALLAASRGETEASTAPTEPPAAIEHAPPPIEEAPIQYDDASDAAG